MSSVKIVLDIGGLNELRNDPAITELCEEIANKVVSAVPDPEDYEISVGHGPKRAHATVRTATFRAMQKNLDGNELLKALGSVGDYKRVSK